MAAGGSLPRSGRVATRSALVALLLSAAASIASAEITSSKVEHDGRSIILIARPFGFKPGGRIETKLSDVKVFAAEGSPKVDKSRLGFFITVAEAESALEADLSSNGGCVLDNENVDKLFTLKEFEDKKDGEGKYEYGVNIADDKGGEYSLFFANCDANGADISFHMTVSLYNVGLNGAQDHLSAGQAPLPTVFTIMCVLYTLIGFMWAGVMWCNYAQTTKVHFFMAALIFFKSLTVLCQAGMYHLIRIHGDPEGWNYAFYVFTFVRGIFFFTALVLIASGWSYLKPFLAERERKVVLVVIPLQVFANVATIILDESSPATKGWFTWRDIFHLLDIICCCAILFPIVWNIKHLREAASADGKAARNIHKLTLWRQFYVAVVSYIYFTRIVVYLLKSTTEYQYVWLSDAAGELATLAFYCVVGFKFRPQPINPYLELELDEADIEELELIEAEKAAGGGGEGKSG